MPTRWTLIAAALLAPVMAHAETRWGLAWQAPEGCASTAELSRSVETAVGRQVFATDADVTVDGRAMKSAGGWLAQLTLVNRTGVVLGSRQVDSPAENCQELTSRLSVVIAMMIEAGPPAPAVVATNDLLGRVEESGPLVHIDVEHTQVTLMAVTGTISGYMSNGGLVTGKVNEEICRSPCDRHVQNRQQEFFIGGPGVTESGTFNLLVNEGRVDLRVKPGNAGMRVGGVLSMIGGAVTFGLGLTMVLFRAPVVGLILMGVAVALEAVGIPLFVASTTRVEAQYRTPGPGAPGVIGTSGVPAYQR